MNASPNEMLNKLSDEHGLALQAVGDAQVLQFQKNGIDVTVTVPFDVLEWFIDASEVGSVAATDWWCDYSGYDDTPHEGLASTMSSDIEELVSGLLVRRLRLFRPPASLFSKIQHLPARYRLEWWIDERWEEALP